MIEVPQIELSLFQMARGVTGRGDILSIEVVKDGEAVQKYTYSNTSMDKIPSVLFSLSDILPQENLTSKISQDFKDRVYLTKFPGII